MIYEYIPGTSFFPRPSAFIPLLTYNSVSRSIIAPTSQRGHKDEVFTTWTQSGILLAAMKMSTLYIYEYEYVIRALLFS